MGAAPGAYKPSSALRAAGSLFPFFLLTSCALHHAFPSGLAACIRCPVHKETPLLLCGVPPVLALVRSQSPIPLALVARVPLVSVACHRPLHTVLVI